MSSLQLTLSPLPPLPPKLRRNTLNLPLLHGIPSTSPASSPNSLRFVLPVRSLNTNRSRRQSSVSIVCSAAPPINARTLQWVSAVSTGVLMLTKGTAIQKSFLVPFFALQAPASIITWIKGEYGLWTAFLTLLVRLFYFIPGELELPFLIMLLAITAPYQAMNLRGTQGGAIVSLAIAAYLAFQHFSRAGSLRRAFDQGSIIATAAIVLITIVPLFFLL